MTATGDPAPEAADQAYFQAIEEVFIALRGAPLLLSPADWRVAQRWRQAGVPLELVRRVLEELFAKRAERGTRGRVNSLRYCAPAVDAAWTALRELQGPGAPPAVPQAPLQERLAALAESLPPELPERAEWSRRLQSLSGSAEEVEAGLVTIDEELVSGAEEALAAPERAELEQQVSAALDRLGDRLTEAEREPLRRQLWRRALRRQAGLPLLTLFSG